MNNKRSSDCEYHKDKSIHLQTPKKSTKSVRNSIQIGFLDVLFVCRNLWTVNRYHCNSKFFNANSVQAHSKDCA